MKKPFLFLSLFLLVSCRNYDSQIKDSYFITHEDYDFIYSIYSSGITIHGLKSEKKNIDRIVIPSEIDGVPVRKIDHSAFAESEIREVVFEEDSHLETIDRDAFADCLKLEEVIFPDSLMGIGENAFYGCSGLEHIGFSAAKRLTLIGSGAFYGNESLGYVLLPDHLKTIGDETFMNCTALQNVTIPSPIEIIGYGAFSNDIFAEIIFTGITEIPDTFIPGWNESERLCDNGTHEITYRFQ